MAVPPLNQQTEYIVTLVEASQHVHYAARTIQNWCDFGYIRSARQSGSIWLVDLHEVKRYASLRNEANANAGAGFEVKK